MYKDKITLWHFDKKNKTREMKAIIHRKRKRDAAGKPSTFCVRGKVVDCCTVSRYLKKKKVLEEDFVLGPDSPTLSVLSGISCMTPPAPDANEEDAPPSYEEATAEEEITHSEYRDYINASQQLRKIQGDYFAGPGYSSPSRAVYRPSINYNSFATYTSTRKTLTNDHPYHDYGRTSSASADIWTLSSPRQPYPSLPISPRTPPTYLLPERLFSDIQRYMLGTFENGIWISNSKTSYITSAARHSPSPIHVNEKTWYVHIRDACALFALNKPAAAGLALRRAFLLLEDDFSVECPNILAATLCVLDELGAWYGKHDLSRILIRHFSNLAAAKFEPTHPLISLSRSLDLSRTKDIRETCQTVLYRAHEIFLGPDHISTLRHRFDSIHNLLGRKDWPVAEGQLRDLLGDVEMYQGFASGLGDTITNNLLYVLIEQEKWAEAESLVDRRCTPEGMVPTKLSGRNITADIPNCLPTPTHPNQNTHTETQTQAERLPRKACKLGLGDGGYDDVTTRCPVARLEALINGQRRRAECIV
jgi:hypothetical protein